MYSKMIKRVGVPLLLCCTLTGCDSMTTNTILDGVGWGRNGQEVIVPTETSKLDRSLQVPPVFEAGGNRTERIDEGSLHTVTISDFELSQAMQRDSLWCWAAAAEMVHRYTGSFGSAGTSQEAIVQRIKGVDADGRLKNEAAERREIMMALVPEYEQELSSRAASAVASYLKAQRVDSLDLNALGPLAAYASLNPQHLDPVVLSLAIDNMPAILVLEWDDPAAQGVAHAHVAHGIRFEDDLAEVSRIAKGLMTEQLDGLFEDLFGGGEQETVMDVDMGPVVGMATREFKVDSVLLYDPWTDASSWVKADKIERRLGYMLTRRMAIAAMAHELETTGAGSK
ncbi:MAG: hypothetical protein AAGB48_04005 [Planctomycetota bacterium]